MVSANQPHRPESRRHRGHRDREGTVGRDAVRNGRVERRHRRDDEEGARRQRAMDLVRRRRPHRGQGALPGHLRDLGPSPRRRRRRRCVACCASSRAETCIKDSVTSLNIVDRAAISRRSHNGNRDQYGVQVSGGSETMRYFVSGDLQNENGPDQAARISRTARFDSAKIADSRRVDDTRRRFRVRRVRANISASPELEVRPQRHRGLREAQPALRRNGQQLQQRLLSVDDEPGLRRRRTGQHGQGFARAEPATATTRSRTATSSSAWRAKTSSVSSAACRRRGVRSRGCRTTATVGLDLGSRYSYALCRFGECPDFSQWRARPGLRSPSSRSQLLGEADEQRDVAGERVAEPQDHRRRRLHEPGKRTVDRVSGTQLAAGRRSRSVRPRSRRAAATLPSADKTLGYYMQEQAALARPPVPHGRASHRPEQRVRPESSSITYPKASLSWIAVGREPFFPQFRLAEPVPPASAYGASGVQPRATDAFVTYTAPIVSVNDVDTPGLRAASLGNPKLKPERTTEFEGGFDTRVLEQPRQHRIHVLQQEDEGRAVRRRDRAVGRRVGDHGAPEPRRR